MNILDKNNNIVISTPINEGSVFHYDLMGEHYIQLVFNTDEPVSFNVGDYINTEYGIFELLDTKQCTYNASNGGYEYRIQFQAYYRKWGDKIIRYSPSDSGSESGFSLTAPISQHILIVTYNLSALGNKDTSYLYNFTDGFTFSIDNTVDTTIAKYISYENTSILDSLTNIAEAFGCEWWVDGSVIHFGRCESGVEIDFILGQNGENVESMSSSKANQTYATRIYAYGSERNLPPNYRASTPQTAVNGIVQRRLMLPENRCPNGYLQLGSVENEVQAIEKVVYFDEEYPKVECEVGQVTTYETTVHNEDGSVTTKTYYRVTDVSGFNFSTDMILDGETLHIHFETGKLSGMEFECYYDTNDEYYEVVMNSDYGTELPDRTLHPESGDIFVLYGWDASMIEGTNIIGQAENRLYNLAAERLASYSIDPNAYTVIAFSSEQLYGIGRRVRLVNKAYFENGRSSRIIGVEFKLDIPSDHPRYTVGENAAYSRSGNIEEKINDLRINGINIERKNDTLSKYAHGFDYLKRALNESTSINGGLILSSLIQLGYTNSLNERVTMSGMNGLYDTGKSIAFWAGGAMTDIEGKVTRVTSPSGNPSSKNYYEYDSTNNIYVPSKDTTVTSGKTYYKRDWDSLSDSQKKTTIDYAKTLFRMDGTGYVASGNISWDSLGRVTLKNLYTDTGKSIDQLLALFSIGGTIPTNAYITPAYPFSDLQVLTNSGNAVSVKDYLSLFIPHYNQTTGELESIESPVPLWSQGEVSALGYDGSGGGGGGGADLSAVWATLTGNTGTYKDYQINIGHLTSALSNYALSSSLATVATSGSYNDLTNKPTIPAAQIQSDWNQTTTTAKDYIKNKPTIPAAQIQSDWNQTSTSAKDYIKNKPTNVSAFTNDANYVTSSLLNTTLESYATTSAMNTELAKYLKLTGGTLSGNLTIERSGTAGGKVIATNSNGSVAIYTATQRGLWDETNSKWIVATNGTNTFMLSGNVGINTTSPSYQLHVNGYSYATRYYANSENYIGGSSSQLYLSIGNTNPIVATSTYVRRGTSEGDAAITLGTSSYRWANTYSVLGNFSGLLTASGNIKTASYIEIGDYRIVADTANTALKVVNKDGTTAVNFYATGENSALGVNTSGGGGGGGMDIEAMWAQLGNSDASRKINYVHIQDALTNNGYATQSWVTSQGYLTSYTETDPVFTASAAHGITSSDITSWNNKVSNVQADWNATSGLAVILNKPTLATVATSGKYSDLTGKPTNVSSFTNDANYVTSSSLATTLASYAKTSDMNTELAKYLPLTGGTLSGNLSIERTGTTTAKVTALNTNGSVSIYQGTGNNRGLYDDTNSKWIVGTNGTNSFLMEGNVGIGTTSPSYKLHIDGTAYASSAFDVATGTTTDTLGYKVGGGTVVRGTSTSVIISPPSSTGTINFYPKGSGDTTGRSIIDNDGKFGINTNTPSYQLHVNGYAYATRNYINGENYLGGNSTQLFAYIGTSNPLVIGETYIRRGTSDTSVTLGTSSYPWANLYSVSGNFSGQITSSVATGTSPLSIASTTLVDNLNADLLDGYHATDVSRLGWVGVSNGSGSSDQCKWYEVNVPTSSGSLYVYDIIAHRNAYPFVAYYRLAIYRYNANVVSVSLINHGFSHKNANQTRVCVAIDANQKVYIQSGSRTASNYLRIRPYYNAGGINTTAVGEAAFGTADGFTALKMVTDSGYFRVDTSAATQSTTYDGDPMMITSLRLGNAYLWWDDANNCLRITGVNSNGVPASSVVVNVNGSGEVTALKTS